MESYFPGLLEMPLDSNNRDDISNYVRASVLELKKHNVPARLVHDIEETLIKGSNGMFLWANLILYDLKTSSQISLHAIRQKLETLPTGLPAVYKSILLAIKLEDVEATNNILRWVVWSERPLKLEELKIAIAIQPGHRSMSALSEVI
jgi:hypothetical protein